MLSVEWISSIQAYDLVCYINET